MYCQLKLDIVVFSLGQNGKKTMTAHKDGQRLSSFSHKDGQSLPTFSHLAGAAMIFELESVQYW